MICVCHASGVLICFVVCRAAMLMNSILRAHRRVKSIKLMPQPEGRPYVMAFVNFADGTLLGKCREMLKVLDGTAPSWNAGIKIALSERGEDSAYCARTLPSALVSRVARSSSGPLAAAHPNGTHARRIHM